MPLRLRLIALVLLFVSAVLLNISALIFLARAVFDSLDVIERVRERQLTALASGADLGIFEIEPTLISQWIDAGYLLPLDDVASAIGVNDFVAGSLFRQNDHVYAVPYAISVYGLWIRADLLKQAGLSLLRNYAELLQAAKTLTKGNTYGLALPAGQNIATVNYFSVFLWQSGGDYFTCDGNLAFGEAATLEAINVGPLWRSTRRRVIPRGAIANRSIRF